MPPTAYRIASCLAPLLFAFCVDAPAAGPGGGHPCAAVADPAQRLLCYDRAFPPAPGARTGAADLDAKRKEAVENFGLNPRQLFDRQPEAARQVDTDRIDGVVADIVTRGSGERVVTLANGQAWLLTDITSRGRLGEGDRVVIRKAALGSYMLLTPSRVPLRAKRLR